MLDVAAGNGNFAIAAARLGATVVATDLTPAMVELGKARSREQGMAIEWLEADAEGLPFPDARFDVVASVFGAMFAPDPDALRGAVPGHQARRSRGDGELWPERLPPSDSPR